MDKGRIKVPVVAANQMSASYTTRARDFKIKKIDEKNELDSSNKDYMGSSFLLGESMLVPTNDGDLLTELNQLEKRKSTTKDELHLQRRRSMAPAQLFNTQKSKQRVRVKP